MTDAAITRFPRLYGGLATVVMIAHLAVSVFIVLGGIAVVLGWIPWWIHIPFAAWGVFVHAANVTCPLTPLEKHCRSRAGERPYQHGFVARYLAPSGLDGRRLDWAVVSLILVVNTIVYAVMLR